MVHILTYNAEREQETSLCIEVPSILQQLAQNIEELHSMTTSSCWHTTRAFLVPGLVCVALLDSSEIWLCVSVSLWSLCSVRIVVGSTRVVGFVRRIIPSRRLTPRKLWSTTSGPRRPMRLSVGATDLDPGLGFQPYCRLPGVWGF